MHEVGEPQRAERSGRRIAESRMHEVGELQGAECMRSKKCREQNASVCIRAVSQTNTKGGYQLEVWARLAAKGVGEAGQHPGRLLAGNFRSLAATGVREALQHIGRLAAGNVRKTGGRWGWGSGPNLVWLPVLHARIVCLGIFSSRK